MGMLWSVTNIIYTDDTLGKSLDLSMPLFSHLQNGASSYLPGWVAAMMSMLSDKSASELCSCHCLAAEAEGTHLPLQTPKFTQGLSWLCEHRVYDRQKDPSVAGSTFLGAVHHPSQLGAEGCLCHP